MGRPSGVSSTPPTASAAAATAPATTPLAGPSGNPLTPSSFQIPPTAAEQQQQELPAQKGHPAATPVFNISPATAAEQAGPIPSVSTTTGASKWKSSAASSSNGPVFSVVSRGNRVGASHTPPAPPAKANSTIARTANRLQGRSTSSTSPSGSSIGLRGQRATPSTLSSSSGPAGRAFGSRIGTGRFGDSSSSTASSSRSCTTPFITNTSCKSVARTLSFDAAADSPKSTTPGISSSKIPAAAAKPKEDLAGKPPAGAAQGLAAAASVDDVDPTLDQLDQLTHGNSSSGDSSTWLSGANNSTDGTAAAFCSSLPFAGIEQPPAADLLGMHGADLASVEALLSGVRDPASSQAAARALLQQLLRSAGSLTTAAGLQGDAILAAVLGNPAGSSTQGSSLQDSLQDTAVADQQHVAAAEGSSSIGGGSGNSFGGVMLAQAARMLRAGASVQQVRQAVMPALLLQLASLAADCSGVAGAGSTLPGAEAAAAAAHDVEDEASAVQVAEAASLLAAGLQAGLAAAKAAVEGTAVFSASTAGDLACGRAAGRKSSALGNLVLLLWSSLLLVVGFVAAAVLSVLEGEAMLGGGVGSGTAAVGFCGVGPGGAYGVAAELCGGLGVGVGWQQQQAGAEMQDWGAAAMQRGRRFGA